MLNEYTKPTLEQRQVLLDSLGESDRFVREAERKNITSLSRSQTWALERKNKHPKRVRLGTKSVAWLLSDLLWFIYQPTLPAIQLSRNTSPKHSEAKK
ncbi:AlpA family phage regulatory protein [Agarivorans sp. B2Z047]|uniref:AlpA family phage regulatory protein n=1 Tax=Agarivorans sp. B2Z047 TaxID=2652721 RepID=UPI00128CC817|nr:AlpA family phage regulatory protein [Agarivorans sp. B2Z047]MPW31266.1 AlpA family phage regulatory protein [Agarivorans sp. B2Z047]UQN42768.1 AlpA family transcriptional regulator [Agarivorans sp. B2Z047]